MDYYADERDYEIDCDDAYAEERRLLAQDASHEAWIADQEAARHDLEDGDVAVEPVEMPF